MICVAIIMLLIVQSGMVVQNGRAEDAIFLNGETTQIVAEAMRNEGFLTSIPYGGYIKSMKDGIYLEIFLFRGGSERRLSTITARYCFNREYACDIVLVPGERDLIVGVYKGREVYLGWTLTNMSVLVDPEDPAIWSKEAISKIATGLAKAAEVVLEQSYIESTLLYGNVVHVPPEEVLHAFIGGVLEVQSGKAEAVSPSWDKTITIPAGEEFSLRFEGVRSYDSFVGAFQVQGGKKIDFFIQGKLLYSSPLIARAYMKNAYRFNAIVPALGGGTYFVVFDNSHNEEDVVVNYRLEIVTEED